MKPFPTPGRLLVTALAMTLLAQPALAQWKWRDKSGRITVSDLPPPRDIPERDILTRPDGGAARANAAAAPAVAPAQPAPPEAAASASAKPAGDAELQARRRAAEQEQAAKDKAQAEQLAAQRQENCKAARSHLNAMESGQRIARMNDKGEREILDDKQRAAEAQRARTVIASDCG